MEDGEVWRCGDPPAGKITAPLLLGDGLVVVAAAGAPGETVWVDYSSDLHSWNPCQFIVVGGTDPVLFGPWPLTGQQLFYRIRRDGP